MKICVCASVFADFQYFNAKFRAHHQTYQEYQTLSPQNNICDMDFYLFTNLTHDTLKRTIHSHWNVITISENDKMFESSISHSDKSVRNVQVSRYFKFQLHKYFGDKYDFIIYLDHHIHLNPTVDWTKIASQVIEQSTTDNLALVQVRHKDGMDSIRREADLIIACGVDSRSNINNAMDYLKDIDKRFSLNEKIIFRENWIFAYSPKHKETVEHFDVFWKHYLSDGYTTKRDQPLWNFLFLSRNKTSTMMNLIEYTTNKLQYAHRCAI